MLGREIAKIVCAREENAKPARLFTRELARTCQRCEFPFSVFTQSYLEEIAVNFVSNSPVSFCFFSSEIFLDVFELMLLWFSRKLKGFQGSQKVILLWFSRKLGEKRLGWVRTR